MLVLGNFDASPLSGPLSKLVSLQQLRIYSGPTLSTIADSIVNLRSLSLNLSGIIFRNACCLGFHTYAMFLFDAHFSSRLGISRISSWQTDSTYGVIFYRIWRDFEQWCDSFSLHFLCLCLIILTRQSEISVTSQRAAGFRIAVSLAESLGELKALRNLGLNCKCFFFFCGFERCVGIEVIMFIVNINCRVEIRA
jgi:hypothetical protein